VEFHRSAYRLYRKYVTGRTVHPLNLLAAAGLTVRALVLMATRSAARLWARARPLDVTVTKLPDMEGFDRPLPPPHLPAKER
jgi:hypothetical protein